MVEIDNTESNPSRPILHVGSRKAAPSKAARFIRLLFSIIDPRAFIHMFRMANYYNSHHVKPRRKVTFGKSPAISPDVVFSNAERITIGDNAKIGSRTHLWAGPSTGRIIIGDNVLIGPDVMITAASYRFNDGTPVTDQFMDEGDVVIGNDVWLGTKVVIMPGVTVGDGAVIGASAVLTKNVPKFAIAAGIPAKIIGHRKPPMN
jgi:acetyltransferase-like isoleucine patch superfamily enzyme